MAIMLLDSPDKIFNDIRAGYSKKGAFLCHLILAVPDSCWWQLPWS
jgi:hypothetical protein